jgi:threonine/homoserine/homoserine lactone efflux protein
MADLLAFLGISLVVIVTPGQDTALTIRNTLVGGRWNGVRTAAGVASGQLLWALAASTGLAALLAASEPVFDALKLAGAVYLVVLGLQALRDAIRGRAPHPAGERAAPARRGFRQGLISNLGTPKMAVVFTGLLPHFAPYASASCSAAGPRASRSRPTPAPPPRATTPASPPWSAAPTG